MLKLKLILELINACFQAIWDTQFKSRQQRGRKPPSFFLHP